MPRDNEIGLIGLLGLKGAGRGDTKRKVYGVAWDITNAQCQRTKDALPITTTTTNFGHFGSVNPDYSNPFDLIYPWSGRKLCNIDIEAYMGLQSGDKITDCVTYWEGDAGFSYSDPYGVWVYTPKFWGRSYVENGYRHFEVTGVRKSGWTAYPEMITGRWLGVKKALTIGGTSKNCNLPTLGISVSTGTVSESMSAQHGYASNYGGSLVDIYALDASLLLFVVEYATLNTQNALGNGVTDLYDQVTVHPTAAVTAGTEVSFSGLSAAQIGDFIPGAIIDFGTSSGGAQEGRTSIVSASTSGGVTTVELADAVTVTTDSFASIHGLMNLADSEIGGKSGYIGTNGKSNAYYRGEAMWGNKWQYILGAYRQTGTGKIWIAADSAAAAAKDALDTNVHTDTGLVLPESASDYILTLGMCDGLSIPPFGLTIARNATNPVGDYVYTPALTTGNTVLLLGGPATSGTSAGGFCGYWSSVAGASHWGNGSRPRLLNPS